jgi:hypothetical protein
LLAFWLTLFAYTRDVGLSMAALLVVSLGATLVLTMTMGLVQLMSPPAMRGRLLSLFVVTTTGAQPLAALRIGQSGQLMGVETAIQANAILLAVGAVLMLAFRPAILRYEYGHETSVHPEMNGGDVKSHEEIPSGIAKRPHVDDVPAT